MKSKVKILVALAVIVSLGLTACAGSKPVPSLGGVDITGVWKHSGPAVFLQLNEDGTYRTATSLAFLEQAPEDIGQYRLEGTSFTFIPSDETSGCKGQGSYELELTEQGQLQFTVQEDACEMRGIVYSSRSWDRVEP
jgi:hypothetical protein